MQSELFELFLRNFLYQLIRNLGIRIVLRKILNTPNTVCPPRHRVPLPEREAAGDSGVRCVGLFEEWLVGVEADQSRDIGDLRCFLMNAVSQHVVRLPAPSAATTNPVDTQSRSLCLPPSPTAPAR
jgi:hypothetical protein